MNINKLKKSRAKCLKNNLKLKSISRFYVWATLTKMQNTRHIKILKAIDFKCRQKEAHIMDKRKRLLRDGQKLNNALISNYSYLGYNTDEAVRTGIPLLDMIRHIWNSAPKRIKRIKLDLYTKNLNQDGPV